MLRKYQISRALKAGALCSLLTANAVMAQQRGTGVMLLETNGIDKTATSITFDQSAKLAAKDAATIFKTYLGIDGTTSKMVLRNSTKTQAGITVDRYDQFINGVRVEFASYTVSSKDGIVTYISGNYYDVAASSSAVPSLSTSAAFSKAVEYTGAQTYMWQDAGAEAALKAETGNTDATYLPKGELVWVEDLNNDRDSRKLHLAWSFDIYATQPLSRNQVFVDAQTGNILYSNATLKHTAASGRSLYSGVIPFVSAKVGTSYRLYDSTRGGGVYTRSLHHTTSLGSPTDFTSTTNTWPSAAGDTAAVDVHWAAGQVYDYWKTQQGRLSWNNADGILKQYIHYSNSYDNAFWDGAEMIYGDGSGTAAGGFTALVSLDVTAHEIGHGVCQATANLAYSAESGALNEGFSDCWGATIENWANPHETDAVAKNPWAMGEEIGGGVPLRRMDFPKLAGLPDTYRGTNWYNVTGCSPTNANDQCGVHTNMGVISKWYYLTTIGGSGTNDIGSAYNVTGIGWTSAAKILYQTELSIASTATYTVVRTAAINAATTLYGACSPEVQTVTNAWYAVGVGAAYTAGTSVAAISGASSVTVGGTTTFTDATAGGTWTSTNPSIATISASGLVTAVALGVDTIKYTVTTACGTGTATKVVTVVACTVPVVSAITGATSVAVGGTTTLSDATAGGVWSASNAMATISASGLVTGVTSGLDTIKYTVTNACGTASASYNITVTPVSADIYTYMSSTTGVPTFYNTNLATHSNLTAVGTTATTGCGSGFSGIAGFTGTTFSTSGASIQVSLTAATGYTINLTGVKAGLRRSSTGPKKARLAYSTNGGTTWVNNGSDYAPLNGSCATSASGTTQASWTGLAVTAPSIIVRIYPYAATATTGSIQVYGMSVIGSVTSLTGLTSGEQTEGVTEITEISGLMAIYPNPNNGEFTVTLPEHKETATVTVVDINGRSVMQRSINSDERTFTLNLQQSATGIYFVQAWVDGKAFNQKVQVNK